MPEKTPKVRIFSTPGCSYCRAEKEYLKDKKVKFEDIDVSQNPDAANEMIEKTGQMGVPVTIIDNKIVIVGFDREALKKALKIKD